MFFQLKPQAPSQLGEFTTYDKSNTPWKILELHVIFDLWCDDDILKTSPCYYVTERLYQVLRTSEFSGITFEGKVRTDVSDLFNDLFPCRVLPNYYLINITGRENHDDFGIAPPNKLIISSEVLELLKQFNVTESSIIQIPNEPPHFY